MSLRRASVAAAFALLLTVLFVPTAAADPITYIYTGFGFNDFPGGGVPGATNISFSMTFDGPLAESTDYAWQDGVPLSPAPTLLSWSMTDGANPITDLDLGGASIFALTTDNLGRFTTWQIVAALGDLVLGSFYVPDFYAPGVNLALDATTLGSETSQVADSPGPDGWTVVPEPSSVTLLILGLGVTALATRRRKK